MQSHTDSQDLRHQHREWDVVKSEYTVVNSNRTAEQARAYVQRHRSHLRTLEELAKQDNAIDIMRDRLLSRDAEHQTAKAHRPSYAPAGIETRHESGTRALAESAAEELEYVRVVRVMHKTGQWTYED